jgi:hypothetical protein
LVHKADRVARGASLLEGESLPNGARVALGYSIATVEDLRAWRRMAAKAIAVVWGPIAPMAAIAWWWLR